MPKNRASSFILIADDDADDRLLLKQILTENLSFDNFSFVEDGEELMDYLSRRGSYSARPAPRPNLILLDLNMPRKDGREALREIKADPALRRIPVLILTTSKAEEDMLSSYDLGANSYLAKPTTFERLDELMQTVHRYWLEFVELPNPPA